MKLINRELKNKIWEDVYDKVREHVPHYSPVREQIEKNLGWHRGDDLFGLKIYNPKWNIGNDLNETT